MQKIQRVSMLFRLFFQFIFIIFPIVLAIYWILGPQFFDGVMSHEAVIRFIPHSVNVTKPLSATIRLYGFLITLIPLAVTEVILYFLIKLFKLYENKIIFSLDNVNTIRKIGITMLIGQLLNPIHEMLLSLTLTWHNPPGHRIISISIDGTDIGILLAALLTILISWIMAEGCKLREEQRLTI
jgi:hypothetical protein